MPTWTQRLTALVILLALITGCSPAPANPTEVVSSATPPPPTPTEQSAAPATPASRELTIWLAPEFAPNPETPAGALLAERLAEFETEHPRISVNVRIKSRTGPGSLLEALSAASVAAPSTLPDLVTLDAYALSEAADLALLFPLDGSVDIPAEPEWYPYVLASLRFGSQTIGLPFASETDILAFRTDLYPSAPRRIETLLAEGHTFQFPAGNPSAHFTMAQYLALQGTLTNEEGTAHIDQANLAEVLSFYQAAVEANVLPLTVRQWTDPAQTWSEIQASRTASAVVPLSLFIRDHNPERLNGAPLPTSTETGIALAHTWSWSLIARSGESEQDQIELLSHLMDPEFLGPWTQALGMLPPNGATLAAWSDSPETPLVSSLVTVTRALPPRPARTSVAAAMLEAVEAVLTGTLTPAAAAQSAAEAVSAP